MLTKWKKEVMLECIVYFRIPVSCRWLWKYYPTWSLWHSSMWHCDMPWIPLYTMLVRIFMYCNNQKLHVSWFFIKHIEMNDFFHSFQRGFFSNSITDCSCPIQNNLMFASCGIYSSYLSMFYGLWRQVTGLSRLSDFYHQWNWPRNLNSQPWCT